MNYALQFFSRKLANAAWPTTLIPPTHIECNKHPENSQSPKSKGQRLQILKNGKSKEKVKVKKREEREDK